MTVGVNTLDKWMATPIKSVCVAASVTLGVMSEPEILTSDVTLKCNIQDKWETFEITSVSFS